MHSRQCLHLLKGRPLHSFFGGMSKEEAKILEKKATTAEAMAAELRNELVKLQVAVTALNNTAEQQRSASFRNLQIENENLRKEIEKYKKQLTLVNSNASLNRQTVQPEQSPIESAYNQLAQAAKSSSADKKKPAGGEKPSKEKSSGGEKGKEKQAAKTSDEAPVDVGRLDLRVGKIVEIMKHPDADSLYIEQIDVGEEKPRTIVSGLVNHIPIEEMKERLVVILCNLKPAKMRGVLSEGMVMCASTPEKVEVLVPPAGAKPGDAIHVDGFPRVPDAVLNAKKKIFETVAPDLRTDANKVATYKGKPWSVPGKGQVKTNSLINVNIK